MSKETAKKLIAELQTNEELKAKVEGITDPEELVKIAHDAGYDVTMEELIDAERAYRRDFAAETDDKLSFDDLEEVAGGFLTLEEAPDGHDMGCYGCYHKSGWAEENDTWCSQYYYCSSSDTNCYGITRACTYKLKEFGH